MITEMLGHMKERSLVYILIIKHLDVLNYNSHNSLVMTRHVVAFLQQVVSV